MTKHTQAVEMRDVSLGPNFRSRFHIITDLGPSVRAIRLADLNLS
jgi:hypothetical protein